MSISERELEENEAKLDNILHKIVESAKQIQDLKDTINVDAPVEYNEQVLGEIDTLAQIIQELAKLADDIDVSDETITEKVEGNIRDKLDEAIARITSARELIQ